MKYVECWSDSLSHITGYKKVSDDYKPEEGKEIWCTEISYLENSHKFRKEKKYDSSKVQSYLLMKQRDDATEEIVKIIKENYIIKTTRSDEKPEMWVYQEGIYKPEGRSIIKSVCREILGEAHTTHLTNNVISKIEAETFTDQENFFNKQNDFPFLIPVQNGLLNIKTNELQPFTHEIPFFNKINSFYKKGKDCHKIKEFLKQILKTEEDILVIQELLGYCLIKEYKYAKAFMFYGAHGRNGKGVLINLIKTFIGINNISGVSLQDLEKDQFAIGNLHNKLVNICGDLSNEALKSTGIFKQITGGDPLSANRKFKERINFINYAKVIYSCNELPAVYTISDAFWLRWVLIEFPFRFLPQKEFQDLDDEEKKNVRLQDQEIIKSITTREELDGLLNFALEGLKRLEEKRDFSNTETARQIRKNWQRKSNSVAAFIEDRIIEGWDTYIIKSDFVKEYQFYCKQHRLTVLSDKVIKATLKESLGVSESQPSHDGIRLRVWNNIKWRSEQGER